MVIRIKERKIVVQSEKQFWRKALKIAKAIDEGKKVEPLIETSFRTVEDLRKTLTSRRLELLHTIRHKEPTSIYALARMVKRDFKNVQKDVKLLEQLGFIEFVQQKKKRDHVTPVVPFDRLHVVVPI